MDLVLGLPLSCSGLGQSSLRRSCAASLNPGEGTSQVSKALGSVKIAVAEQSHQKCLW